MNKKSLNNIVIKKWVIVVALFCFVIIIARTIYIAVSPTVDGIDLKQFANNRDTAEIQLDAKRGNIYDKEGNALAENVSSYTLIAYLDSSRTNDPEHPNHVVDKEYTAKQLATVLSLSEEQILSYLSQNGLYQVEFGSTTKALTELTKEKIVALNLPGIDFIESRKRYYPNNDFASYVVGYAKKNEESNLVGELGIEQLYNKELEGTSGKVIYQQDANGYKIAGTNEIREEAKDGYDIYLTIDSNIQFFVEQALNEAFATYKPEWMTMLVADAKTGAILASSTRPSYDPNVLEIKNYYDLNISLPFEPGSTMKIYSYMTVLEKGTYKGNDTFMSGKFVVDSKTSIYDWKRDGWGRITYDRGFALSSNVGVSNLLSKYITASDLRSYYKKLGFGSKTGIKLSNEASGQINFKYASEVYSAGFGQGITTTPMQHIKALTAISNNGVLLQPYIIDKIVDPNTKITIYDGKKQELERVASQATVDKIKQLMYDTVNVSGSTGTVYKVKGYDVIGKTGTAQIYNPAKGTYYSDTYNVIRSVSIMYPKDNPEVIIYMATKRSKKATSKALSVAATKVITNTAKYLNVFNSAQNSSIKNYETENYLNKNVNDIKEYINTINAKVLVIGNGDKIINQYPAIKTPLNKNDVLMLLTNKNEYVMPNLVGFSLKDAKAFCNLINLTCEYQGTGYVSSQSIKKDTKIDLSKPLKLVLK